MIKNFANLIKVKTIIAFIVFGVWAYLAVAGIITADAVNNIALMVIAFYFGKQHGKKDGV